MKESMEQPKRRRTAEADAAALEGLSDQLQSVSLAISAAMKEEEMPFGDGMAELRKWYQTEVFAATDAQQQRWEERRWAFLGQLQDALKHPLVHTVFNYRIDCADDDDAKKVVRGQMASAFGGLLFVGRSRYNDIVVADETVSRVHCIIVRTAGKVGIFDGWSSYGTLTIDRGRQDMPKFDSALDDRRPLLFDEHESFTLRVGKNAIITFPAP
ncbi:hypothetical protein CTAYLR_000665 [Chrysophaeum taylorii]|uniref:FHA domain-containing protein n=1 Tax=Chrysophaeum taylorii TaxID=2483200 RepID=A0AAD7XGB8_9STRA|nr:hypothetical protein CTAYLR_000665 [Chrysophaeum taylorii]